MARLDLATTALCVTALTALSATGCSDPPAPPARAGMVLDLGSPTDTKLGACGSGMQSSFSVGQSVPTATAPGEPTTSGQDGVNVTCTIKGKSSGYSVSARIESPLVNVSVGASVPRRGVGPGEFSANIPSTSRNLYTRQCEFHTDAPPLIAGKGEIHTTFRCINAQQPSVPGTACNLSGVLVLLRCQEE